MRTVFVLAAALALGIAPTGAGSEAVGLNPEFAESSALILGFNELVEHHPKTLVEIVRGVADAIAVVGVVANDSQLRRVQKLLSDAGAPIGKLDLVQVPVVGMWMRDYGPSFVRLPGGGVVALDAVYGREAHSPDEWVPRYLAGFFRLPLVDVPLRIAGGNLLTNGEGWIFTTSQVLEFNSRDGQSQEQISQVLGRYYGATDWLVLEPLAGEPTEHVDMFLTLVAPDVAVVGQLDPSADPANAERLDAAAARLAAVRTKSGAMRVVRIPMPSHRDGKWRSYTNVIFANDRLLVPSYPDVSPEADARALAIYTDLLPERRIVPVDSSSLIEKNGSLHCISVNVPKLRERSTEAR